MEFEEYTTKPLNTTNRKFIDGIVNELEEKVEEKKLDITKFFRISDQVYVFKNDKVRDTRIDCSSADDRGGYDDEEEVYYLQLQKGKETYANVIYPETNTTIQDLIEGIRRSLVSQKGVKIRN